MTSVQVTFNARTDIFAKKMSVIVMVREHVRTSQGSVLRYGSPYADVTEAPIPMNVRLADAG
jgi:hypothetical protein